MIKVYKCIKNCINEKNENDFIYELAKTSK